MNSTTITSASTTPDQLSAEEKGFSDWIDRELVNHVSSRKLIGERDLNSLLELRDLMSHHRKMDPAEVIREFFRLRKLLEQNFYLLCYRLRNWLSIFYELEISDPLERTGKKVEPLDLRFRDFGKMLNLARHRYFEEAPVTLLCADIRISVVRRMESE